MKKLKIGEEFEVKEEGYLQSVIDEKITPLKVGDKGIMTKSGIRYLSGEAKDSIVYNIVDRPSYDTENIAKRILQNLKYDVFRFEDLLYDEEIKDEEVINSILEELEEFI